MKIDVWYGDSNTQPIGPIEGELLETLANGEARFRITDKGWLKECGFDKPPEYTYGRLPPNRYVSYDAYAWCPVGEGGGPTNKWW